MEGTNVRELQTRNRGAEQRQPRPISCDKPGLATASRLNHTRDKMSKQVKGRWFQKAVCGDQPYTPVMVKALNTYMEDMV